MNPYWYRTFFEGVATDFWRYAATPEWTFADVELAWTELKLKPGDRVLDCPCGHGRHAVELARRGCRVTGVDISTYSLNLAGEAAREAQVSLDLRHGDMLDLPELPTFEAAITLGNAFGYLDHAGTGQFVKRVSTRLARGGRWLIDTGAAAESLLPALKPEMEFTFRDIEIKITNQYLVERSCLETTYTFIRGGKTEILTNWHHIFTIAEIRRMLVAAGLETIAMFGSAKGEPFVFGSRYLFLVAEKHV